MFTCANCGFKGYADPKKRRILSIDSIAPIAPGASCNIVVRPQLVFQGDRIFIEPSIAECFAINDIRVGYNSQLNSTNPLNPMAFSAMKDGEPLGTEFTLDRAVAGIDVTFIVTNMGVYNKKFAATVFGYDCE